MMKKTLWIFVMLGAAVAAQAETVSFVTGEFAPYAEEAAPGQGLVTEIVRAVTDVLGWEASVEFLPWKRCEFRLNTGAAFAAYPYIRTPEREKDYWFSDVLGGSSVVFFYDKAVFRTPPTWKTLSDLKAYSIGGVIGTYYETAFRDAGITLDLAPTEDQGLEKLVRGRTQLLCLDAAVGLAIIQRLYPRSNLGMMEKPFSVSEFSLMVSKTYPRAADLLAEFNRGLKLLRDRGTYQKILKKHGF